MNQAAGILGQRSDSIMTVHENRHSVVCFSGAMIADAQPFGS